MRIRFAAVLVLATMPAFAHRLDEYLQGTILSVEKNRVEAQMTLTPGVAVFPGLIARIDTDANGIDSDAEQQAYAATVLNDLSLAVDGHKLTPRLLYAKFPPLDDMREGRGEIQLEFDAALPQGVGNRKLTLENRHQSGISAYQVNCLVPKDPAIQIQRQNRNYSQSSYELDFLQDGGPTDLLSVAWMPGAQTWVATLSAVLLSWIAVRRAGSTKAG